MSNHERVRRIARELGLTPTIGTEMSTSDPSKGWTLYRLLEPDAPVPMTRGCTVLEEALDAAEGWLGVDDEEID